MSGIKKIISYLIVNEKKTKKLEQVFDDKGNLLIDKTFDNHGDFENLIVSTYDINNRVIEQQNYLSEDELGEKSIFERDDEGKITKETIVYPDDSQTIKTYLRNGFAVEIKLQDDEGEFEGMEIYTLNESNNILEKAIFNDENKQIEKIKNEFDTNGLLIKSFEFEGDNLAFELNYEYDANSNISKITKYNNKKVIIESVSREYDEQNRLVLQKYGRQFVVKTSYNDELRTKTEERTDAQGNIQYKMETHYDENGNILEEKTPLSTTIYEYEFF
ncbi:MAG TPA: hypothetical protein DDX39_02790 [Bacteroidales bacterium]|nr:MAG: hypothetical protein A2W98_06365 [Bacteroidetes bacterium GWF2_33_38]OFY72854.1 MAG: hypothetical protein A2265_04240 [Bacteroidetes bacterium RIFOXYA12_FULL_33_9]OFY88945.1 MAG: hypothetical protein A2236_07275 [Bacteroidetes bacterium RIFOXYA2_FULL_33_7]HBF87544.1 hypothetical protein [Bacteroidales bacterium]